MKPERKICATCKWHKLPDELDLCRAETGTPLDDDYTCTHEDVRLLAVTCPVTGGAGFLAKGRDGHYIAPDPYPSCVDVNAIDARGVGKCPNWEVMT